ncbi:amino acid aminotransferase [Mycolicibacterium gadium]|uniref:Uncharacterized protein n=1 Tax=Mycolicibacterium gadium TaxID=1794 RepID=A0A7I7WH72_MYCGU|nr:amino acid aminotransferase [Mycolicibacterium gadium]BBZ16217.1 hypothetical protein MGAD_05520 [Mycolicibacterium gadium]
MATTVDTPPTDPETAALDYLVRIGEAVPKATALAGVLRDLAGVLHVEGALSDLTAMADARVAAATRPARPTIPSPRSGSAPPRSVPGAGTAPIPTGSPRRSTAPQPCWT